MVDLAHIDEQPYLATAATDARPILHPSAVRGPYTRAHWRLKRVMDVTLGSLLILVLLPTLALVALAIALDSSGPVVFRQARVGRFGRIFTLWKFRTMVRDADAMTEQLLEESQDPHWLHLEHDPRLTRIGRFLRRTSLDELPQLVNVVRGEMTLVGPRPLSLRDDEQVPAWATHRRQAVPGMTGLWQVSGRTTVSFEGMLELDCEYVETSCLRRDMKVLVRTVPAVFSARGAN